MQIFLLVILAFYPKSSKESLPEMIAILEFGRRGTGDEKVDHQNRPEFS